MKKLPPTQKYRPYLSLAEMNALLNCIDGDHSSITALSTAKRSIQKMKLSAEMELASAAYKTNPRTTLEDKLGFFEPGEKLAHQKDEAPPDFEAMMEKLSSESTPIDPINMDQTGDNHEQE